MKEAEHRRSRTEEVNKTSENLPTEEKIFEGKGFWKKNSEW